MEKNKKQLIETLAHYGAGNVKISLKQQRKLREWILPYLMSEFNIGNSGPMNLKEMRKFIDRWETKDLNEKEYKYYYVDKNSDGKSLWDLI